MTTTSSSNLLSRHVRPRTVRIVLWAFVVLVAASAIAAYAVSATRVATAGSEAAYATPFRLTNQNGATVSEAKFLGKPSAWFYGYTHCPDACPTALSDLSTILQALGPSANQLNVVFVSIDPERDTPAIMKEYVEFFDPRITSLTGTVEAVSQMAKDRDVVFAKVPGGGGEYTLEHRASIQLVTAEGRLFGTLSTEDSPESKLGKVRQLMGDA